MENKRHRILVVDDESIIAMDLQHKLTRLGYEVPATAGSAEEAIEKVAETQPDLVLMDIRLEGSSLDGVEAAERIRERYGTPVVFLTAFADDETLQRAKLTGPYGYLVKPFSESELRIDIEIAIYTSQAAAALRLHARREAAIAEFSQRALSELRIEVLLEDAALCVAQTLDLECCYIGEMLPDGQSLRLRAGVGWRDGLVGETIVESGPPSPGGATLFSQTLASLQPVVIEDMPSETKLSAPAFLREHGIASGMSVVIPGAQDPFGLLGACARSRRAFTPDDANFLQAIANVISQAIQRQQAEEGLRQARDDIEERKRVEQERLELLRREQEARQEAEAANRAKDEFLAVVSHELRTPLTSIMGWASLLRTKNFDKQAMADALEIIERHTKIQAQLIDDILDVSRIITGKLHMEFVPVELATVIAEALNAVHPTAVAKGVQMKLSLDASVGQVWGDANRLQQVVWNLLANAIKFTPKEGFVEVRLERSGSMAQITVRDNGAGISPQFLPHIFERFRQADSSSTRRHGGLGLGLAIVRHLVEIHGGRAEAHSEGEGHGATFIIRLPLLAAHMLEKPSTGAPLDASLGTPSADDTNLARRDSGAADGKSDSRRAPRGVLDGVRVLVVDDDFHTCQLLGAMLKMAGAEVQSAASAAEALQALQRYWPDVLLSDIGMPGEDGYSLIRKVRALEAERGIPLPAAALTAYARPEDRELALAAGFQFHLTKPVLQEVLLAAVAELAGKAEDS